MSNFTDIISSEPLLESLANLGFSEPTAIQLESVPIAIEGKDLVLQAQTGSGKTIAFCLPLISKLLTENITADNYKNKTPSPLAILIAPTRELAIQIQEVLVSITKETPTCLVGGVDIEKQKKSLAKDERIVVGTPGRILDCLKQKIIKLNQCKYFVLDEADEMLSMGFLPDVRSILSRLPDIRQGVFVSATITPRVDMLVHSFLSKPEKILIEAGEQDHPDITHYFCDVKGSLMAKPHALCDIIETQRPDSAIIFCNTKSDTKLVEALLRRRGFDARRINSDLSQSQRNRIMKRIKNKEIQFLVATDVAARGIDIEEIELVVNYTIHEQAETYLHRTGRTGRAGKSGRAISLIGPQDFGSFHFIQKILNTKFEKLTLPSDEEVSEARLAHLHEILREQKIKVSDRDKIVATKLLKDLGEIENPPEDLENLIAKLCITTVEHFINEENKALDEEEEEIDEDRKERPKRDKKEARSRDKSERPRKDTNRSKDKKEVENRDKEETRSIEKSERPKKERPDILRIYLGLGTEDGFDEKLFLKTAKDIADIDQKQISAISIRKNYGYADLEKSLAMKLIKNTKETEVNNKPLLIEVASNLSEKKSRRRRN